MSIKTFIFTTLEHTRSNALRRPLRGFSVTLYIDINYSQTRHAQMSSKMFCSNQIYWCNVNTKHKKRRPEGRQRLHGSRYYLELNFVYTVHVNGTSFFYRLMGFVVAEFDN